MRLPVKDPRFIVLGDGALVIGSVQASDAGYYICFIGTDKFVEEKTVELTVKTQDELQENKPKQNSSTPIGITKQAMSQRNFGRHAIPIDGFADYVAAMHDHKNAGFSEQFKLIDKFGIHLSATVSKANKKANRYKNIATYDHSRVVLPIIPDFPDCQSNYIAAAYIDGYYRSKKYIATQGPLKRTCTDFWRMIWAEDIPTVVMLTHLHENIKGKCHQYWPGTKENDVNFGPFVVSLLETDVYANYTVRTLAVALGEQKRTVCQYHFTVWPDHDVPTFATGLLDFIERVNRDHPQGRGPTAIHCSAGVGRTGTYIVIDTMLDRAKDTETIDIYGCVKFLRTRRAQMVQTEIQYTFIHDAVMEGVICGDTKIPVHNVRDTVTKMHEKDPESNMTTFEMHFKVSLNISIKHRLKI
jgi:netrin-G3 ligand